MERTKEILKEAILKSKNPAIWFSFGKDSLVCVDIARRIKPDILVINIDRGEGGDLQEAINMYDEYAKEYNLNYHRIKTPKEIFEIYKKAGSITKLCRNDLKKNLIAGSKIAREQFNIDCEITGLRIEESNARSYLKRFGTIFVSKTDKILKCMPVLYWTGQEIWAYIISNNIPYLKWYDTEAPFVGYERARYSNWAGVFQVERGRYIRLKKNYPNEFRLLCSILPDVTIYT